MNKRKTEKAKARRKDYEKKRNIWRNTPRPGYEKQVTKYQPVLDSEGKPKMVDGRVTYKAIGKGTERVKLTRIAKEPGKGILPASMKFRQNKRQKAALKGAMQGSLLKTVTNK